MSCVVCRCSCVLDHFSSSQFAFAIGFTIILKFNPLVFFVLVLLVSIIGFPFVGYAFAKFNALWGWAIMTWVISFLIFVWAAIHAKRIKKAAALLKACWVPADKVSLPFRMLSIVVPSALHSISSQPQIRPSVYDPVPLPPTQNCPSVTIPNKSPINSMDCNQRLVYGSVNYGAVRAAICNLVICLQHVQHTDTHVHRKNLSLVRYVCESTRSLISS